MITTDHHIEAIHNAATMEEAQAALNAALAEIATIKFSGDIAMQVRKRSSVRGMRLDLNTAFLFKRAQLKAR